MIMNEDGVKSAKHCAASLLETSDTIVSPSQTLVGDEDHMSSQSTSVVQPPKVAEEVRILSTYQFIVIVCQ